MVEAVIMVGVVVDIIIMVAAVATIVMVIFHVLHLVVLIPLSNSSNIINTRNISNNPNISNTSSSLNIVPEDNIGRPGMLKNADPIAETRQPPGNTLPPRYTVWELNDKEIVITDSLGPRVPVGEPLEVVHGLQDLPEAHGSPWAHEGPGDRGQPNTTTTIIVQANP